MRLTRTEKEKELILSREKIIDDIVTLKSTEGVALRAGILVNINGKFRVVGKTKNGKVLATELTANTLTHIETSHDNLDLIERDEKKFRKVYDIVTRSKYERRLKIAENLWND